MKVQVKQILTHTPPCTSCPIVARSFKTGFSCAGLSSLFTLSLNWTADIPQTVANTAQSVALRAYKKQMHFMYLLTSQCVMAILEGQRFHASSITSPERRKSSLGFMQKPNIPASALNLDLEIKAVFCWLGEFFDDLSYSQSAFNSPQSLVLHLTKKIVLKCRIAHQFPLKDCSPKTNRGAMFK